MKRQIFVLFMVLAATPAAWADAKYDKCMDSSGGSNLGWNICGNEWVERADHKLNEVWKLVYGKTEGQTKGELLTEQRAWNAYKEKSCNFFSNRDEWGREGQVVHYHVCRAGVIEDRIKQLQEYGKFMAR